MNRFPLLSSAAAAVLLIMPAVSALADEPPLPPASYERTTSDGAFTVKSTVDPALTSISSALGAPEGAPYVQMWFIPGFNSDVVVATNGASALVLPVGTNLIEFEDPARTVVTFHRPGGASTEIPLGAVLDPATLIPTTSHFLWTTGVRAEDGAFVISLPNGATARIDAATGAVMNSPVGARPQTDPRIVGVVSLNDGECLTYGTFRESLTALGPREPLPDLPAPFADGCTVGFEDQRLDIIQVFEEGVTPAPPSGNGGFLAAQDPLYGLLPVGGEVPEGTQSVRVNVSRGMGVGSMEFILNEAWDAPHIYESGSGQYRTIGLDGLSPEETRAALETLTDRWADGPRRIDAAQERNDLSALLDGRHHIAEARDGPNRMHLRFEKTGNHLRGADYIWSSDYLGCFDLELGPDGLTGKGDAAFRDETDPAADGSGFVVKRGVEFDYGKLSTLRPLPQPTVEEHLTVGRIEDAGTACLASLDAGGSR